MTQVAEAFTDTTMENPAPFLDCVRKQTRQFEPQESSGETVVTTGRSNMAVTTDAVATGKAWLPQSCRAWDWSLRERSFADETFVTTGQSGVAVAADKTRLPQCCFVVQQEGGKVVFLLVSHSDFVQSNFKTEHPIILELYDLLKEHNDDEDAEQVLPKTQSVSHAIVFAKSVLGKVRTNPVLDLHPDGEVSLTWRSQKGIINIAFREDGIATYAAYLAFTEETHKGRFRASSVIPINVINLIEQIEKP